MMTALKLKVRKHNELATALQLKTKKKIELSLAYTRTVRGKFIPPSKLKGLFVGSGVDAMSHSQVAEAIMDLSIADHENRTQKKHVLYLGTATYDLPGPKEKQTIRFVEQGWIMESLDVARTSVPLSQMKQMVDRADVIIASGGNTLYAVDRWKQLGLTELLRNAMHQGVVLAGGSAGAICWFDGGHSDSMDPATFQKSTMKDCNSRKNCDESFWVSTSLERAKDWEYIRVDGLGFLPGLICPHHDRVQSNGILRATDFDEYLKRHPTELGIGIDHWAALEVNGDRFRVVSVSGKKGSVLTDSNQQQQFSPDQKGVPGVWIKEVIPGTKNNDTQICTKLCPKEGNIRHLLRVPAFISEDPRVEMCRLLNPLPLL